MSFKSYCSTYRKEFVKDGQRIPRTTFPFLKAAYVLLQNGTEVWCSCCAVNWLFDCPPSESWYCCCEFNLLILSSSSPFAPEKLTMLLLFLVWFLLSWGCILMVNCWWYWWLCGRNWSICMSSLSAPSGGTLGEFGTISVAVDDASSPAFSMPLSDKSSPSPVIFLLLRLRNSRFKSLNETSDELMPQLWSTVIVLISFKSLGFGLKQERLEIARINSKPSLQSFS